MWEINEVEYFLIVENMKVINILYINNYILVLYRVFYKMKCRYVRNSLVSNFEFWVSNFGIFISFWVSG